MGYTCERNQKTGEMGREGRNEHVNGWKRRNGREKKRREEEWKKLREKQGHLSVSRLMKRRRRRRNEKRREVEVKGGTKKCGE